MKIRNGFVSNSSSSSFIVAVKESNKCPTCGRSDDGFLSRFPKNTTGYEETSMMVEGAENIFDRIIRDFDKDMNNKEVREKMVRLRSEMDAFEKSGYRVAFIEMSYHDNNTNYAFQELRNRKDGSLVVIKDYN